ncbi:MarR family winged helix-turn-helix transcriptional regulator [Streptomyces sp. NPDC059740]|uniref:MarR family winged helix-turn-helix transcriptional regulator n=1 Tax=Streptomyces sp. NPDC059740 TaxID=3346926 RepID=UPI00364BA375
MNTSPSTPRPSQAAARAASEVIELLEVLWERGRDATSSAPVSTSQLRVMYVVEREEGINLRSLGDVLGAGPSSVSRLCDRLEAVGFVRREHSPLSRREIALRLTAGGRAYLAELRERREEALVAALADMSDEQRAALADGLSGFQRASEGLLPLGREVSRSRTARSA